MNRNVTRRRAVQQYILQMLFAMDHANPGCSCESHHLYRGLGRLQVPPTDDDVRSYIADLLDRQLIVAAESVIPSEVPGQAYGITMRGREFVEADFPWDRVSEFAS